MREDLEAFELVLSLPKSLYLRLWMIEAEKLTVVKFRMNGAGGDDIGCFGCSKVYEHDNSKNGKLYILVKLILRKNSHCDYWTDCRPLPELYRD